MGVSLGNRGVTDKSIGGDSCMECGNCKDKHWGETGEMGIICKEFGLQVQVKSEVIT